MVVYTAEAAAVMSCQHFDSIRIGLEKPRGPVAGYTELSVEVLNGALMPEPSMLGEKYKVTLGCTVMEAHLIGAASELNYQLEPKRGAGELMFMPGIYQSVIQFVVLNPTSDALEQMAYASGFLCLERVV